MEYSLNRSTPLLLLLLLQRLFQQQYMHTEQSIGDIYLPLRQIHHFVHTAPLSTI
jgi:hypothetical protein